MFAIDKYVLRTDIYKPAEFDSYYIPKQWKNDFFRLYDHFEPGIASSQSNRNDSKWECDKYKEEGICFAKILSYSSFKVRIALTIFGQGTRLLFLQNERTYLSLSQLTLMATQLFHSREGSSEVMNRFVNEECKNEDGSITSILQRSSKPLGFGPAIVQ